MSRGTGGRGRIGSFDAGDLIVPALVLGGGYLLYKQFFSGGGVAANNATVQANTTSTAAGDLAKSQAAGISQTVSDGVLNTLANTLYQQLSAISNGDQPDESGIVMNAIQVNTLTDWNRLVQLFGTRQFNTGGPFSVCSWTALECTALDLGTALKTALDATHISSIDSYFAAQGINVVL